MTEHQAYKLLRVVYRMLLMFGQGRMIGSGDLQEWSREIAWDK